MCVFVCVCLVAQSYPILGNPMDYNHHAPLSMGFLRQEYWSVLPCPSPGDLPYSGIELTSLAAPALQADSLPLSPWGIHVNQLFSNVK